MSNFNFPIKNLSVRFSREQKVFQQLTHKDALMDALISLYNNTVKCQHKDPQESASTFIQLYKPICHEINKTKLSLKDFKILNKDTFVEGAFGKVTIVKSLLDKENNIYAMKTLNKSHLIKQAGRSSPMEERLILSNENEEWLPKLYASFQDTENLYLVMEYAHGGDLENLMGIRDYKFNEDEARFYCAELILAIERVHELGYMHRDIKPANILIDSKGHIKLGDLGCCISIDTTESLFPVGTALYMSPEMSDSTFGTTIYGPEADWWSVGIILYELLYGVTPFTGKVSDIQKSLMNPKVKFNEDIDVSKEAKDLISRLLLKSKSDRLGVKDGAGEIKSHPFFKDINWKTLRKEAIPPFIPSIKSLEDTTFFAATNTQEDDDEDDYEDDEEEDEEEDNYRDYPFIGYSYTCSLLNIDKSPVAIKEKQKIGDNKAFLAQFRQKMTQPLDSTQFEEEKEKLKQQYDSEIAELKALIDEKSNIMDNMRQQIEEEKAELNSLHSEEISKLTTLLENKDTHINQLESKIILLESNTDEQNSESNKEVLTLNQSIEEKDQHIKELKLNNEALESSNKKLESNLDDLLTAQEKLESSLNIVVEEKKELEAELDHIKKHMKEQSDAAGSTLQQQLFDSQNEVQTLKKEITAFNNNESKIKIKMNEELHLLEAENEKLYAENTDLNEQLLELESEVAQLNDRLSTEAKKAKELIMQAENKLKDQANDYDMLIKQTKAESMELKNELSKLHGQSSTATRMKRAAKSLPNIPSNPSPKLLPSAEYSPGEGRSLIMSSMWQRDRESLRNVQQALEESESKLAFAKRQVIRLKKEVKCFQKYTFEQQQKSEDSFDARNKENGITILHNNGMDYSDKKPLHHKKMNDSATEKMISKKYALPLTPPQNALDYSPSINGIDSFVNDIEEINQEVSHSTIPSPKKAKGFVNNETQFGKKLPEATTIGDSDMAILREIKKEQNFINSTKRTIAARIRLSRSRGEIDQELERSLELSNKKIIALQNKLEKPMSMVTSSTS